MHWTKYPDIDALVDQLVRSLQGVLGSDLKGVYLFGSLVGGDFDEKTSDIDLLAVVREVISESQLKYLKKAHQHFVHEHSEWADRVEVAYVSIRGIRKFKTTTSKIARISPGEPLHFREMDINWLIDWHMVQNQGVTVLGPPPKEYIPHISDAEYLQFVRKMLPMFVKSAQEARHKGAQSYVVMSFCRNLYALKFGKQTSKFAGSHWVAKTYPEWSDFITQAIKWHGMKDKSNSSDTQQQTIKFADFATTEAVKLKTNSTNN